MATQAMVRRIALALPGVVENTGQWGFHIPVGSKQKGIAWVWLERVHPKRARVPQPAVLCVRVANEDVKDALIAGAPEKFFTEPHYNGYAAVQVRLAAITAVELRELLTEAWRCQAPPSLREPTAAKAKPRAKAKRR